MDVDGHELWVAVPAAGIGKRMGADRPKQYLPIAGVPMLQRTLERLAAVPGVAGICLALAHEDGYFDDLELSLPVPLHRVIGGAEREHSVLAAVRAARERARSNCWVLVHDAARPCVRVTDIEALLNAVRERGGDSNAGGLLAMPARDTMKRANNASPVAVDETLDRRLVWHALTPQLFRADALVAAIEAGLASGCSMTDEAAAMERSGAMPLLVQGHRDNIKVTEEGDDALAEYYLSRQAKGA